MNVYIECVLDRLLSRTSCATVKGVLLFSHRDIPPRLPLNIDALTTADLSLQEALSEIQEDWFELIYVATTVSEGKLIERLCIHDLDLQQWPEKALADD